MIGNAVPPLFSKILANSLLNLISMLKSNEKYSLFKIMKFFIKKMLSQESGYSGGKPNR